MIMTSAAGTSIPTSMTVLATRMGVFADEKFLIIFCRSVPLIFPWMRATLCSPNCWASCSARPVTCESSVFCPSSTRGQTQ